jgi:hypothetical protein
MQYASMKKPSFQLRLESIQPEKKAAEEEEELEDEKPPQQASSVRGNLAIKQEASFDYNWDDEQQSTRNRLKKPSSSSHAKKSPH